MRKQSLYLFPDTNLFIQCLPLDQIKWSELGDFEEIRLIVSRPVQREIDNQKKRGNSRVAQRARKTYPLFRRAITNREGYELVNNDPSVKIFIQPSSIPNEELSHVLDYTVSDDQIVGCCHQFKTENPSLDVRLLTHDTGPMMSAKSVDMAFIAIDDDWLIPPEHDESEREIARLNSELSRLKKAEPAFQVNCVNEHWEEIRSLVFKYRVYEPLSYSEVSDFAEIVEKRFPIATEFNQRSPKPIVDPFRRSKYVPPSQSEILKYENEEYPRWLDACESFLRNLHETLQEEELPYFCFVAQNTGIQPAQDALIVICAKGNFNIRPPKYVDESEQEKGETRPHLPKPPIAPRGRWTQTRTLSGLSAYDFGVTRRNELPALPDISQLYVISRDRPKCVLLQAQSF